MGKSKIPPLHPGEVLFEEFLKPLKISQNKLGRCLGVSPRRINEIIHGKRLGLQMDYDLDVETDRLSHSIKREVKKLVYT